MRLLIKAKSDTSRYKMFKISEIGVLTTPCMNFFGDSAKTGFFCLSYIKLLNTFDDFGVSELSFSNLLIPF